MGRCGGGEEGWRGGRQWKGVGGAPADMLAIIQKVLIELYYRAWVPITLGPKVLNESFVFWAYVFILPVLVSKIIMRAKRRPKVPLTLYPEGEVIDEIIHKRTNA